MKTDEKDMKLVTVAVTEHSHEAEMLKNLLSNEEIDAYIQDEFLGSFIPFAVGGVKVLVEENDEIKARQILAEAGYTE
ncbi:MAG: DUF2007 domain-containing protein [Bacteroidales bacterium]|jgi:hypothetical protein|nr:DUF2007 domain-containing protein [Bacteroidales bacterium]MDD4395363.1 DUF2007 domain-containing protein [Bacteroidales bacterium]